MKNISARVECGLQKHKRFFWNLFVDINSQHSSSPSEMINRGRKNRTLPFLLLLVCFTVFFTCCFGTICDKMGGSGTYRHIFERHETSLLTPFCNLSWKGESPEQLKMAPSSCNALVSLYNYPLCPNTFAIIRLYSKLTRTSFPCENIHHMEDHASRQN